MDVRPQGLEGRQPVGHRQVGGQGSWSFSSDFRGKREARASTLERVWRGEEAWCGHPGQESCVAVRGLQGSV